MAVFAYTALDRQGRQTSGTIPADSRAAAMDQVLAQGLSPITLEEKASGNGHAAAGGAMRGLLGLHRSAPPTRVPQSAVEAFTRELANLLSAGLPLSRALHLLAREASHPAARNVWSRVHDDVVSGTSLADALGKWPRAFSAVYVAMVRAGEAGGFLHVVLQQIADFRAREQELKGKVKAAMVYPAVLGCLAIVVLVFLLTFFIPRFSGIFQEFGGQLPWLTQLIIALSGWMTRYGPIIGIAVGMGLVGLRRAMTTDSGRRFLERAVLHTPLAGTVAARFALVRFCRMLGTLVGAGVPLVSSLRVAREALGNQTLADTVNHAIEQVQRGQALSRSLAGNPLLFPASVIEMIAVAEETGRLDKELVRLAGAYELDLDRHLRMLVALVEPAMLFIMAGLIGTVVVGMLLPVFTLQDLIK
ncbi:type II secretion system F family protein [Fontivita pretiosa]|uniref:type II secretion system F family protein n=1 Tax=Fontivita pretiosa TaxID=2989684 RepID=UPI003D175F14